MNRDLLIELLAAAEDSGAEEAIRDTLIFLALLHDEVLPSSIVLCAMDGEVNLFWDHDFMFLDIGFDGSGEFQYSGHHPVGTIEDNVELGDGINKELKKFFKRYKHS